MNNEIAVLLFIVFTIPFLLIGLANAYEQDSPFAERQRKIKEAEEKYAKIKREAEEEKKRIKTEAEEAEERIRANSQIWVSE